MPPSPLLRARARNLMDNCSSRFIPLFYRMLAHPDLFDGISAMMLELLHHLDAQLREVSASGPYWFGEQFTLVDIAFFPFIDRCGSLLFHVMTRLLIVVSFVRLKILKEFCGFEVSQDDPQLVRFNAWRGALFERPSVRQTALYEKHKDLFHQV
jgi:glutathione S-transferase